MPGKQSILQGCARAPVTCGELVQGAIAGQDFLVTCPLELYSRAVVYIEPEPGNDRVSFGEPGGGAFPLYPVEILSGQPESEVAKAVLAVRKTIALFGLRPRRVWLDLSCPAPAGKGMGSSSADIVAAARAAALSLGRALTPRQLARLALSIEPSDGVMFPGVTLFDHRRGKTARVLGAAPPAKVLIFDYGGKVDTLGFNHHPSLQILNRAKEKEVTPALKKVLHGLRRNSLELIGEGATQSALAHQGILPKADLAEIAAAVSKMGARGVVCAHSGTVIGVLYPRESPRSKECERFLSRLGYGEILGEFLLGGAAKVSGGKSNGI